MSNTPKLSRFTLGILWFDSIPTASIHTTGSQDLWNNDTWTFLVLKTWQQTSLNSYEELYDSTRFSRSRVSHKSTSGMTNRQQGNDSCRFEWNRQHFQPTPHSPPEVKIHEIKIHEPSSFLKCGHRLKSIHTIRVNSIESIRTDNIFNPPSRFRSPIFSKSHTNWLPACQIDRRGNDLCGFNGRGFMNQFPVSQITNTKDESTLVGCIGKPAAYFIT